MTKPSIGSIIMTIPSVRLALSSHSPAKDDSECYYKQTRKEYMWMCNIHILALNPVTESSKTGATSGPKKGDQSLQITPPKTNKS